MSSKQRVTSEKGDIPSHYVPLSSFGYPNGKTGTPGTPAYTWMQAEWAAGRLPGIKLMRTPNDKGGPVFVDPADLVFHEEKRERKQGSKKDFDGVVGFANKASEVVAAVHDARVEACMNEMYRELSCVRGLLERLVDAVEAMATQPK